MSQYILNFTTINKKRLHDALFLTIWNSRKISTKVRDNATVDARGRYASPCFVASQLFGGILRLILSVRVSPLPSYLGGQCEKPQVVGRQRVSDPTLSFCKFGRGGVYGR